MTREAERATHDRDIDIAILKLQMAKEDHSTRLASLEAARQTAVKTVRRWPYIVIPIMLIAANLSPEENVKIVIAVLKALV